MSEQHSGLKYGPDLKYRTKEDMNRMQQERYRKAKGIPLDAPVMTRGPKGPIKDPFSNQPPLKYYWQ